MTIDKEKSQKACKACAELNELTEKWTLDFAPEAFRLYFSDKKWLLHLLVEALLDA